MKNKRKKSGQPFRTSIAKNILMIACIVIAGFVIVNIYLNAVTRHNKELQVPDFTGMTADEAATLAEKYGLRTEVTDSVYIRGMARGQISRQNPEPGSKVKKGRRILLVINSVMPRQSVMPSITGYSLRQAKTELAANGLRVGRLIYKSDLATNNVLAQRFMGMDIEPGTKLNSGSRIDLILGLNPKDSTTYVPNVIGYKYQMAADIILDNSLNIFNCEFDSTVSSYADSLESFVYGQYPLPSDSTSVKIGSSVTLFLSKDTSRIPVPDDKDSTDTVL